MAPRTHQASPDALEDFGLTMTRSCARLQTSLSASRATTHLPGKLDGFGVLDELTAVYPASAAAALRAVEQLTEVLDDLDGAARASAARFRQADRPAQAQA